VSFVEIKLSILFSHSITSVFAFATSVAIAETHFFVEKY
jgi:hypothetical protein